MPWFPSFPAVRHYADGRQVLVVSQAELDALEPGHADSPGGPFPEPPAAGWAVGATEGITLGHRIRVMAAAGQTQQAIAEALGVSRHAVRRALDRELEEDDASQCP